MAKQPNYWYTVMVYRDDYRDGTWVVLPAGGGSNSAESARALALDEAAGLSVFPVWSDLAKRVKEAVKDGFVPEMTFGDGLEEGWEAAVYNIEPGSYLRVDVNFDFPEYDFMDLEDMRMW